jgi:hypothetical protein
VTGEKHEAGCGQIHRSIEDAINHAEANLGAYIDPYREYHDIIRDKYANIVGYRIGPRRLWRLDVDPDAASKRGVHVYEENLDAPPRHQKLIHRIVTVSVSQVYDWYRKWTSRTRAERENLCGQIHSSIEDAIVHAEKNLGMYRAPATHRMGTMRHNSGIVIGFRTSATKGWRLDFDPDPTAKKWVHVNEENFDAPPSRQKILHLVASPLRSDSMVETYYRKWTSKL